MDLLVLTWREKGGFLFFFFSHFSFFFLIFFFIFLILISQTDSLSHGFQLIVQIWWYTLIMISLITRPTTCWSLYLLPKKSLSIHVKPLFGYFSELSVHSRFNVISYKTPLFVWHVRMENIETSNFQMVFHIFLERK